MKNNNRITFVAVVAGKFDWPEQYIKILNLFKENNYIEIHYIRTYNKKEKDVLDKHFINKKYKNNFVAYDGN